MTEETIEKIKVKPEKYLKDNNQQKHEVERRGQWLVHKPITLLFWQHINNALISKNEC